MVTFNGNRRISNTAKISIRTNSCVLCGFSFIETEITSSGERIVHKRFTQKVKLNPEKISIIKSPKQSLLFLLLFSFSFSFLSADHELVHSRSQELTEFHETLWSYRYMFLVGPKVFSFVVKGVKVIFWGVQRGWVSL